MVPAAHPRVCGENSWGKKEGAARGGSSPRVRGKPRRPHRPGRHRGLIPACAGKTGPPSSGRPPCPAHPRVCGENGNIHFFSIIHTGSSPRVRGKRGRVGGADRARGLIPACAGKTERGPRRPSSRWAHPRVCGENPLERIHRMSADGSSPRVRGKQSSRGSSRTSSRLIPACAGKTSKCSQHHKNHAAHPRVCGENDGVRNSVQRVTGSSPRVRGKLLAAEEQVLGGRLIPACAGKTASRPRAVVP